MPRKQPLGRKYKVGRQGGDAKPKRAVPTTRDEEQPPAASSSARADVDVPRRLMIGLGDVLVERFVMELIDDIIFEAQVDLAAHAQSVVESRVERKKAYAALKEYANSFLDADCWVDYDEARYHYLDTKAIVASMSMQHEHDLLEAKQLAWGEQPWCAKPCSCCRPCECDPGANYGNDDDY